MPGLFDRFKKKREEEQMNDFINKASAQTQGIQPVTQVAPSSPSIAMDPRNGEYDYSQAPQPVSNNTTDVQVGASKGSAMWTPYSPIPKYTPAAPQDTGEEDVVEPSINGMTRKLPFPTSPQNTGEEDVVEQTAGKSDDFDYSLAEPTNKQKQEELAAQGNGSSTLSDLEYLEAMMPINKDEEERRLRTASAMNGLTHLGRALAAFGNYAYASKGAPAITLPQVRNEDIIDKWQDRMDRQKRQYLQSKTAIESHRMQMDRAQQQLELEKQRVEAANQYKEAQAERMRIQTELDRIKLDNGGISPELEARLKAAQEKEDRLRDQFNQMYGLQERRVAVAEKNADTSRINSITNQKRANAYIVNRGGGGAAGSTVDFIVPNRDANGKDEGYGGTVYSVKKTDWSANRRTLAKKAGVETTYTDVNNVVHSRKDEDIDGDIIANWNSACDEVINNAHSTSATDYNQKSQDKKSSGKKASEKKEVIKDDVQKKAEELRKKGVKLEL